MLGPTVISQNGVTVEMRRRERDVLAALALNHPRSTAIDEVIVALWPDEPPLTARTTVQNHISRIRRSLGRPAIVTEGDAYRLGRGWALDIDVFEANVHRARNELAFRGHALALSLLREALMLVGGEAYADLPEATAVNAERARTHELRATAEEVLVEALLAGGDVDLAIAHASSLVETEPLRETRWMLLALALYRGDRRRESLRALDRCRHGLREVAGLEPGPGLQRLETLILGDEPKLHSTAARRLLELDVDPGHSSGSAPEAFIGRSEILATVRHVMLAALEARRAHIVEITGTAGVGKTAFARRIGLQADLDGWTTVAATCHAVPARPFEPFGDLLLQVVEHDARSGGTEGGIETSELASLWGDTGEISPTVEIGQVAAEWMLERADRGPILMIIDDANLIPPSSARLVRQLGASAAPIVILTARGSDSEAAIMADEPEMAADAGITRLTLTGLDIDETALLLDLLLGEGLDPATVSVAHALTGGNPNLLLHAAGSVNETSTADLVDPSTLVDRVLRRSIESLSPLTRQVADILAVAGGPLVRHVVHATLTAVEASDAVRVADLDAAVREGLSTHLMRSSAPQRIDLDSAVVRSWLLEHLDGDERTRLHHLIGLALLGDGANVLAAAPHLLAGAQYDQELAIDVAASAERVARTTRMFDEAAQLAADAAALAQQRWGADDHRTCALVLSQAEDLRDAGDPNYVELLSSVAERAKRAGDDQIFALAVAAMCKLGPLTEAGNLNLDLAALIEQALGGDIDSATRAAVAGQATLFYSMSGRVDLCRTNFHVALQHARRTGDDRLIADALGNAYASLSHPDDWQLRAELATELMTLAEHLDDDDVRFQSLHLYFSTQVMFSDPLLRTVFSRQAALAESLRSAGRRWMVGYQRACLEYLDGRLDEAEATSTANCATAPVGPSRALTAHLMTRLVVRLAQGRGQELREETDSIVEQQPGLPGWRAVAAWLAALRGDHDRVLIEHDFLMRGPGLPPDMSWSGAVMLLGRAVATTGDTARCAEVSALLAPHSGLMTWVGSCTVGPFDVALAELALAMGKSDDARRYLESARRCVQRLHASVYEPDLDAIAATLHAREG